MIADIDGAALRAYLAGHAGRTTVGWPRAAKLVTGRGGVVTSFSSAGLTAYGPIAEARRGRAGRSDPVRDTRVRRRPVRRLRRDEHGRAARGRRCRAPAPAASQAGRPGQVKSALVSTAATAWGDTAHTVEASAPDCRSRPRRRRCRERSEALHRPGLALVLRPERHPWPGGEVAAARASATPATAPAPGRSRFTPRHSRVASKSSSRARSRFLQEASSSTPVTARASAGATPGEAYGMLLLRRGATVRKVPYALLVTRPGSRRRPCCRSSSSRSARL